MWYKLFIRIASKLNSLTLISAQSEIASPNLIVGSTIKGKVTIGEGTSVQQSYLSGNITIGKNTSIWGPNTDLYAVINSIQIGNFCSIARNVSIQEYNHNPKKITTYLIGKNIFSEKWENELVSKGNIEIGNDVWIGAQCVILSGARIGNGAIIAANSVVNGEIPPYAIAAGSPGKVIGYRFSTEVIKALEKLQWWNWPLEKIKANKALFENELVESLLNEVE